MRRQCSCVPDEPLSVCEAHLQANVVNFMRMSSWLVYHTHDSRHSAKGFPDIIGVRPIPCVRANLERFDHPTLTEAVAIELKSERGKVTPEQEAWLDLLRRLPGVKFAGVIRPSNWMNGELDDVLR